MAIERSAAPSRETAPTSAVVTQAYPRAHFAVIFLLALALRGAVACTLIGRDPMLAFFNQASELGCLAHSVINGHGLASPFGGDTGPSAFLAPGYPLLVALAFHIFGAYSEAAEAALVACQVLFGALTVPVLMAIASRILGTRIANIAGVLCAASPTLIWLPLVFWETSLSSLFLTSALALALQCSSSSRKSLWVAMGLLCGFAMLVNPALMLVLIAAVAWAAWRNRSSLRLPAFALVAWLLIFAPWSARNLVTFHTFIPLRSNMGYELWQGNRAGSDGAFSAGLHPNVNLEERERYAEVGEVAYMQEKSALATAAIKSHPDRFIDLCLLRITRFWTGITSGNHSTLLVVNILLTSILGSAGLFFFQQKRHIESSLLAAPFLLYPLPYYITHADFRFRLLLEPIALILSVYAVQHITARAES